MSSPEMEDNEPRTPVPDEFICPLTLSIMDDPCVTRYGHSYERSAILEYISRGNTTCPMSRRPLGLRDIISNHKLRCEIRKWQKDHGENVTILLSASDSPQPIFGFISLHDKTLTDETERTEVEDEEGDILPREVSRPVVRTRRLRPWRLFSRQRHT